MPDATGAVAGAETLVVSVGRMSIGPDANELAPPAPRPRICGRYAALPARYAASTSASMLSYSYSKRTPRRFLRFPPEGGDPGATGCVGASGSTIGGFSGVGGSTMVCG